VKVEEWDMLERGDAKSEEVIAADSRRALPEE
jgi:hypothetical protein